MPGRESTQVVLWKKKEAGQRGLISCITFCPDYSGMFACGSYTNTVGIYDENTNSPICVSLKRRFYWRFYRNFVALERACYKVAIEFPIESLSTSIIVYFGSYLKIDKMALV
jgi:hypothetical protein